MYYISSIRAKFYKSNNKGQNTGKGVVGQRRCRSIINRLCSVYSVCGQSRGYFIAPVWDVFRALVF